MVNVGLLHGCIARLEYFSTIRYSLPILLICDSCIIDFSLKEKWLFFILQLCRTLSRKRFYFCSRISLEIMHVATVDWGFTKKILITIKCIVLPWNLISILGQMGMWDLLWDTVLKASYFLRSKSNYNDTMVLRKTALWWIHWLINLTIAVTIHTSRLLLKLR